MVRYCLALLAVAFSFLFTPQGLLAQGRGEGETSIAHLPGDCFFAVVIRPRQMLEKYAKETTAPLGMLKDAIGNNAGIDVDNLNEFVFAAGFNPEVLKGLDDRARRRALSPDNVGLVINRFHKPVDQAEISEKLFPYTTPAELDGKRYLKPKNEYGVAGWFADERTLVFGREVSVVRAMTSRGGMSSLTHHLRRASDTDDVVGVLSMETGGPYLRELMKKEEPPAPFHALKELPDHLDIAVFSGNLSGDVPGRIDAQAVNAESAERLEKLAGAFLSFMRTAYAGEREQILQRASTEELGKLTVDVFDKVLKNVELRREGRQLTAQLNTPGGMVSAGELMIEIFADEERRSERYRRASQLSLISQALKQYMTKHKGFPPAASYSDDGKPLLSWRVHILPHLPNGEALYKQFKLDQPWDSEHNKKLLAKMPPAFAYDRKEGGTHTRCLAVLGEKTVLRAKGSIQESDVKDSERDTALIAEVAEQHAVPWTKPADFTPSGDDFSALTGGKTDSHFLLLMVNGRAYHIKKSKITPEALRAMFSIDGGEEVSPSQFRY